MQVGKYTYGEGYIKEYFADTGQLITIGKFCSIAEDVRVFLGGEHEWRWGTTYPFGEINQNVFKEMSPAGMKPLKGGITIGNEVWIGNRVTIMSGVTIGNGAVLANNAHVVKDIGAYEIWGGNPARLIAKRFSEDIIADLENLQWWNLTDEQINNLVPLLQQPMNRQVMDDILAAARAFLITGSSEQISE